MGDMNAGKHDRTEVNGSCDSMANVNILYITQDADYFLNVSYKEAERLQTLCSKCETEINSTVTEEGEL